ncbi:MAG: hypothetical protein ACK4LA_04690 [Aquificaceae bacterium]
MNLFVISLSIFSFLSITLFEGAVIIGLAYVAIVYIKKKKAPKGILIYPLLLHAVPTLLSTLLYAPQLLGKAIERSIFLLLYLGGSEVKLTDKFLYQLNFLLVSVGFLLFPIVMYNYKYKASIEPLWGGIFEVATFYSLFSLSALALWLKTRRVLWFFALLLFLSMVFFTLRRSTILGLLITLVILLFLMRAIVKLRYTALLISFSLLVGFFASYNFLQKDVRFQTLYKVITGQVQLDSQTLDTISSLRWANFVAGLEVIKEDIKEGKWLPLLTGHGIKPETRLYLKPPAVGYESILFVSEFIEKGLIGLLAILWLYWRYYTYLLRYKIKEPLVIPFLLMPSVMFVGSLFTGFWDALLPLYFLWFKMIEEYEKS